MALQIVEGNAEGIVVLELEGEVVAGEESDQLRKKIREVLDRGRTRVVLDVAKVHYMDSTGLGALVAGYTAAQHLGARLKLANPTKRLRQQLNVLKLSTIFEIHESIAQAVASFA